MPETVDSAVPRVKGSNSVSTGRCGGRPGPPSCTATSTSPSCSRAWMVSGVPAGVYLAALSSRLTSTRSMSTASSCSSGRLAGTSVLTGCSCRRARIWRSALPTTSSSGSHSRCRCTPPCCRRAMSSRFSTSRCMAWAWMRTCSSMSAAPPGGTWRCAASAAPRMVVSGVRRSCETADSKVLRMRSPSMAIWVCWATATKC